MANDHSSTTTTAQSYGLLAEYSSAEELVKAAQTVRQAGYRRFDAYSPMPISGLADAVGVRPSRLPFLVLIGGICGGLIGYGLQYWTLVISYPINVGGRPLHSWPAFIPVTFELTILGASLTAVLGMLALNGLPQPYHPLFNIRDFTLASQNRFFLCVEVTDPLYNHEQTETLLKHGGATSVTLVEY